MFPEIAAGLSGRFFGKWGRGVKVPTGRHHPRKRVIQYAAAVAKAIKAGEYWIPRFRGV
jgi:hypothetical protein